MLKIVMIFSAFQESQISANEDRQNRIAQRDSEQLGYIDNIAFGDIFARFFSFSS